MHVNNECMVFYKHLVVALNHLIENVPHIVLNFKLETLEKG